MTRELPICTLSVDLDNQWSYMKTHGDTGWETFPSYLDLVVPRILESLQRFGWRITFFIVGQDAALKQNQEALRAIAAAGHEIGNHSFHHEPWLHLYTKKQTADEIARAEVAIEAATGYRPRGFRGPGYSLSRATLEVLAERDYLYDASTLPTYLGPLARWYFLHTANLTPGEREQRKILFGGFGEGRRPLKPYLWEVGDRRLVEIPVTTMPIVKLPFHFSYLFYLATKSTRLAVLYLRASLLACRHAGVAPSLLLHPLDFISGDEAPELLFFPSMTLPGHRKRAILDRLLGVVSTGFAVSPLKPWAQDVITASNPAIVAAAKALTTQPERLRG
jgi:peptidoglycan/xylan/chitin deacetylase (PgdA/CDA1 family)